MNPSHRIDVIPPNPLPCSRTKHRPESRRVLPSAHLLLALGLGLAVGSGCAPSGDISGWELVPKNHRVAQMETFPEIPLTLPPTPAFETFRATSGPIYGTYLEMLDPGSIFRRGYSIPTP